MLSRRVNEIKAEDCEINFESCKKVEYFKK